MFSAGVASNNFYGATALAMFYAELGLLAFSGLVLLPMFPAHRRALTGLIRDVRAVRNKLQAPGPPV